MILYHTRTGRSAVPRHRLQCALAALAICFVAAGCSKKEAEVEPVVSVQVQPVKRTSIAQIISADAVIFPVEQAVLTPKITSTVKSFAVQRGSKVHKGELLAVLESADLAAALDQSKGEFQQAEAAYASTTGAGLPQELQKATLEASVSNSELDAQQKIYDSRKSLFDQGALPRRDLDSAEVALAQARSQHEVAQRQLDDLNRIGQAQSMKSATGQLGAAKGKYLGAQAQLSYSEIRSPIEGVVTDRPLYAGELAAANQPLLTVMDTTKLIAKAHISQREAAALRVGDSAEIDVPGTDDSVKAKVSLISPALDPGSSTIEVWFEVRKPPAALRPGNSVHIEATAKSAENVLVVPAAALLKNSDGADYVLLAGKDDHAHQQLVKIGIRSADAIEITDGIKEGDSVVTVGAYGVPDKTKLKIEQGPSSEPAAADDTTKDSDDKSGDTSDAAKSSSTDKGKK